MQARKSYSLPRKLGSAAPLLALALLSGCSLYQEKEAATEADTLRLRLEAAQSQKNKAFAARFAEALKSRQPDASCYRLLFVPGWRYESVREHGGDLATIRARASAIGIENEFIATQEDGTVEANADLILRRLRANDPRPTIIVSVSKGSAETALALDIWNDERRTNKPQANVLAWVNINGLLGGTPLADLLTAMPMRWFTSALLAARGQSMETVQSITTSVRRDVLDDLDLPKHMVVVNYQAAPTRSTISRDGLFGYLYLATLGPNDGISLLKDTVVPNTITLYAGDTDHFLHADDRVDRIEALIRATVAQIGPAAPRSCARG